MNGKEGHYVLDFLKPKTKNSIFVDSFTRNGKKVRGFYRRKRRKKNDVFYMVFALTISRFRYDFCFDYLSDFLCENGNVLVSFSSAS